MGCVSSQQSELPSKSNPFSTTYLDIPPPTLSLRVLLSGWCGRDTESPGHCTENHSLCSLTDLDLLAEHKDPWLPTTNLEALPAPLSLPKMVALHCSTEPPRLFTSRFPLPLPSLPPKSPPREPMLIFLWPDLSFRSIFDLLGLEELGVPSAGKSPRDPRLTFLSLVLFFGTFSSSIHRLVFFLSIFKGVFKNLLLKRVGDPKPLFLNPNPSLSMVLLLFLEKRERDLSLTSSPGEVVSLSVMIVEPRLVFLFRPITEFAPSISMQKGFWQISSTTAYFLYVQTPSLPLIHSLPLQPDNVLNTRVHHPIPRGGWGSKSQLTASCQSEMDLSFNCWPYTPRSTGPRTATIGQTGLCHCGDSGEITQKGIEQRGIPMIDQLYHFAGHF